MVHAIDSVDTKKLILGNCKIEVANYGATTLSTWTNLGAGVINDFNHNVTKWDTQAGNAPDPIQGIADETVVIDGSLIEYDASVLASISCGIATADTSLSTQTVYKAGGNTELTPKAFRLTNRRIVSGATKETVFLIPKGYIENGLQMAFKSDNDGDPIATMAFTIAGVIDTTLTVGSQLYTITRPVWS